MVAMSMADHLRSQEYSHLLHSSITLTELGVSDEDALHLFEEYRQDDLSAEDYLAEITQHRPFTPPATEFAVEIDTGTYCTTQALPIILKSFLQDNGNPVVKKVLAEFGVVMMEKGPSGKVLLHVRSADVEQRLVNEEVKIMGRKFKIKRRSPFSDKFFLDISGIRSANVANELFLGFCAIGLRPVFMTPRDVHLATHVATPTWRFYFGEDAVPRALWIRGFVTNQVQMGGKFFVARGKGSTPPPERANSYRASHYAVQLPTGAELAEYLEKEKRHSRPPQSHHSSVPTDSSTEQPGDTSVTPAPVTTPRANASEDQEHSQLQAELQKEQGPAELQIAQRPAQQQATQHTAESQHSPLPADPQASTSWTGMSEVATAADPMPIASRLKRDEPASFADTNPFEVLDSIDCDFEETQPTAPAGVVPGVLIVPHVKVIPDDDSSDVEHVAKWRAIDSEQQPEADLSTSQLLQASAQKAVLESREDRVTQNVEHVQIAKRLLQTSKNMDQIVQSMQALPLAWSMAMCEDLLNGGQQTLELADIHLWNRVLAAESTSTEPLSFFDRMQALKLPIGNTRSQYAGYLATSLAHQPAKIQDQWRLLRWLSLFELLALAGAPFLYDSSSWLELLLGTTGELLPHAHVSLLSDATILLVIRSPLGKSLIQAYSKLVPTSASLMALEAIRTSSLSPEQLPELLSDLLKTQSEVHGDAVDMSD